jgi:hypothetical protein
MSKLANCGESSHVSMLPTKFFVKGPPVRRVALMV